MLKSIFGAIVMFLMVSLSACVGIHAAVPEKPLPEKSDNTSSMEQEQSKNTTELQIQVGDQVFTAELYDNASAGEWKEALPVTFEMRELNGNEKYYYMDSPLPADSERVFKINAGDIMLYGSDCLVLFYDSFSTSYSYTRLGKVDNVEGLKEALGKGNIQVTFRLKEQTISAATQDGNAKGDLATEALPASEQR